MTTHDTPVHDHVALARQLIQAVNDRDVDTAVSMLHSGYEATWPHARLQLHDAIAQEIAMITAFPDIRFDIVSADDIGSGVVVVDARVVGTHAGDLVLPYDIAVAATGSRIEFPFQFVMFFENGLLRRETLTFDHLAMLDQLGALDALRSASPATPVQGGMACVED